MRLGGRSVRAGPDRGEAFLAGLADGVHVFAVAFTLTDGGTATASVEFTIDTPTLEETCTDLLGGIVTYNPRPGEAWECLANPYLGPLPAPFAVWRITFQQFCPYPAMDIGTRSPSLGYYTAHARCLTS